MTVVVEGAGVPLAVSEHGTGRPMLVIHGIAAAPLDPGVEARAITYDRRGYGGSGAPEPYGATTVHEQAEDAAAVLRATAADEPAVVLGDGFGALVALDLASRHAPLVSALVLVDPPLFAFVPEAAEALAAERLALEAALREGGPEHAVATWLGGEADARARDAHGAFFADLAGLTSWPVTRGALRAIAVPAAVVTAPGVPAHLVAAADALAGLLPGAHRTSDGDVAAALRTIPGP